VVTISTAGDSFEINWDAASEPLRDWLRFTGSSTTITQASAAVGSRAHEAGFYPTIGTVEDDHEWLPQVSQSRSDNGNVQTIKYGTWEEHTVTVWLFGWYHSDADTEFRDLKDWYVDHGSAGETFRLYYDKTELDAFSEALPRVAAHHV
jgi:hypothetical protein